MEGEIALRENNSGSSKKRGMKGKQDPEESSTKNEGISVVPVRKGRKGSKWRGSGFMTKRGDQILSYTCQNKITYRKGDCVYLENTRQDLPYYVCSIKDFRLTKRETLVVVVKWYFRSSEVPDSVYQLLVQDRHHESTQRSGRELVIQDPNIRSRELFISDASDTYPVRALRGRCKVLHYQDIYTAKNFSPDPDSFFYVLEYNPKTKRLATTQGEIRVGHSHQARLPEFKKDVALSQRCDRKEPWETLRWRPQAVMDGDLMMYLRAARSVAAFAGMCDGGSTEDGCQAASMDETTINAMDTLHHFNYDTGKALQSLVKSPALRSIEKKWTEEDSKRFIKGLRLYGKNFFKIHKELLPYKETGELVEYYYFWKKTPAAASNRPYRRHKRPAFKRNTRSQRPASSDFLDLSSASECSDQDSDDSGASRELSGYSCRHCCTTVSKDWHHAGKDKGLRCTDCRMHFKRYGEERPLDSPRDSRDPSPLLFQPVKEDKSVNGRHNMRTRQTKETIKGKKKERNNSTSSPDIVDSPLISTKNCGRKSPSTGSTCSNSSTDRDSKKKTKKNTEVQNKGKKRQANSDSEDKLSKKKKPEDRSDSESASDSSSLSGNDEENGNDGDVENNQDDLSSPPSTPRSIDNTDIKTSKVPQSTNHPSVTSQVVTTSTVATVGSEPTNSDKVAALPRPVPQLPLHNFHHPHSSPPPITQPLPPPTLPLSSHNPLSSSFSSHSLSSSRDSFPLSSPHPLLLPLSSSLSLPSSQKSSANTTTTTSTIVTVEKSLTPPPPLQPLSSSSTVSSSSSTVSQDTISSHREGQMTLSTAWSSIRSSSSPLMSSTQSLPQHSISYSSSAARFEDPRQDAFSVSSVLKSPFMDSTVIKNSHQESNVIKNTESKTPSHSGNIVIKREPVSPPQSPRTHRPELSTPKSRSFDDIPRSLCSDPDKFNNSVIVKTEPYTSYDHPRLDMPSFPSDYSKLRHPLPTESSAPINVFSPRSDSVKSEGRQSVPIHEHSTPKEALISPVSGGPSLMETTDKSDNSAVKPEPPVYGDTSIVMEEEPESDGESGGTLTPGPEPTRCSLEVHRSKHAILLRVLNRGDNNMCSRCDLVFRPHPDSKLSLKRPAPTPTKVEEKKKPETPPPNSTADAQITSSISAGSHVYDRHTPRSYHDTPALRQLSEYAKPHVMGQDPSRSHPFPGMSPSMDPLISYRMAAMYPPGSRERLELELERDKRERDAREREIREREIREMEMREKLKADLELKQSGLLPPGANPLDPHWLDIQRRFYPPGGPILPSGPSAGASGNGSHIPGVYPPTSLASDLMQRERERLERLGMPLGMFLPPPSPQAEIAAYNNTVAERLSVERLQADRMAMSTDPMVRLQMANIGMSQAHTHTHAHSHTHLHLHQQDQVAQAAAAAAAAASGQPFHYPLHGTPRHPGPSSIMPPHLGADPLATGLSGSNPQSNNGGHPGLQSLPPGISPHAALLAGREQEMLQNDLYRRAYADPAFAHQLSAQAAHQEALQRHMALERERFGPGSHLHH